MMKLAMDHIVIYASNIEESEPFYAALLGLLGFEKTGNWVFSRDGMYLDIREALGDGEGHERGDPGVDHVGFTATDRAQVDRVMMDMMVAGFDNGRITEFDNGDYALFIADPNGVRFEVTCYARN